MKPHVVPILVVLSLCLLTGCGASPATIAVHSTPTTTPTPLPLTPTTDLDPFQVDFFQHYQVIPCPAEPGLTNLCYTLQDDPTSSSLGKISFAGTDVLYILPASTSCGPAERHGELKLTNGNTITIHATGTYCVPSYRMQLTFTVTGGTGPYRHATGGGTIAVGPARNSPPTASEFWSGTIRQS